MSGVGVTGLIANLPGTVTPYPTQDPSLELGGCREVADAAARDAIPANFRAIGMLVTLQDTGVTYQAVGGITNADWKVFAGAGFVATYYVDPVFTGIHAGSESNPFATIAAAFAYAATQGITSGIVFVPPNTTITENIVFPVGGINWEIACQASWGNFGAIINGTIDLSGSTTCRRALTNLQVIGAITGVAAGGTPSRVRFGGCTLSSTVTLTGTAGAIWRAAFVGLSPVIGVGLQGSSSSPVNITGTVASSHWRFFSTLLFSSAAQLYDSQLDAGTGALTSTSAGANTIELHSCGFAPNTVLTASSGSLRVSADGATLSILQGIIATVSGAVVVGPLNGNGNAQRLTLADNAGVFTLSNRFPQSLLVCEWAVTLLVAGTTGALQINLFYTDLLGVAQTKVITPSPLNISSAAGTEISGAFTFSQNGATTVQFQMSGVTTPGALSYSVGIGLRVAGP